jgi:polar amino acid transport system substrate-binding protein
VSQNGDSGRYEEAPLMRIRSISALVVVASLALSACSGTAATPVPTAAPTVAAPTATPVPVPTAAPTAVPTAVPPTAPTITAAPTATPLVTTAPTDTPVPTVAPTATPVPTATPLAVSAECMAGTVATKTAGVLTVSTDNPAFPPWFGGTVPSGSDWADYGGYPPSGQGFESAIAYAVAKAMGFTQDQVTWVGQSAFGLAFKPGDKNFDFHVGQVSYKPPRAQAVDFTNSYYDVTQAIVALADNPITSVTDIAGLKQYQLGAATGTTSLDAIEQVIQPTNAAKVYGDNDKAVRALKNKNIDGLVTDLPTAFEIAGAELNNGKVFGQLPPTGSQPEYFGMVVQKGSAMTACLNQAIAVIKADGTWQAIYDQWLTGPDAAPILK